MGLDRNIAAYGVVGTLHEISRFEHFFPFFFQLDKQFLTIFQTSISSARDDGIRGGYSCFSKASKEESNELFMILPILLASIGFTYLRMSDNSSSELISTVERIRMLLAVC